jgi:hypothetical protein
VDKKLVEPGEGSEPRWLTKSWSWGRVGKDVGVGGGLHRSLSRRSAGTRGGWWERGVEEKAHKRAF